MIIISKEVVFLYLFLFLKAINIKINAINNKTIPPKPKYEYPSYWKLLTLGNTGKTLESDSELKRI